MRQIRFFVALALLAVSFSVSSRAYADSKPVPWFWWESHWDHQDFIPYLEDGTHPHNSQWDHNGWSPEQWEAAAHGDAMAVVQGFYRADIIRRQYVDDDTPVLEVGPGFYMLGGEDKRRVTAMVDYVYGVTMSKEFGMYKLVDWRTGDMIGAYTKYGLQIQ